MLRVFSIVPPHFKLSRPLNLTKWSMRTGWIALQYGTSKLSGHKKTSDLSWENKLSN